MIGSACTPAGIHPGRVRHDRTPFRHDGEKRTRPCRAPLPRRQPVGACTCAPTLLKAGGSYHALAGSAGMSCAVFENPAPRTGFRVAGPGRHPGPGPRDGYPDDVALLRPLHPHHRRRGLLAARQPCPTGCLLRVCLEGTGFCAELRDRSLPVAGVFPGQRKIQPARLHSHVRLGIELTDCRGATG